MDNNIKPSEALRRGMKFCPPSQNTANEAFRNEYFIRYWGREHCEYSTPLGAMWVGIGHNPQDDTGTFGAKTLDAYLRKWSITGHVKRALRSLSYKGNSMHKKAIAILEKHEALLAEIERDTHNGKQTPPTP